MRAKEGVSLACLWAACEALRPINVTGMNGSELPILQNIVSRRSALAKVQEVFHILSLQNKLCRLSHDIHLQTTVASYRKPCSCNLPDTSKCAIGTSTPSAKASSLANLARLKAAQHPSKASHQFRKGSGLFHMELT